MDGREFEKLMQDPNVKRAARSWLPGAGGKRYNLPAKWPIDAFESWLAMEIDAWLMYWPGDQAVRVLHVWYVNAVILRAMLDLLVSMTSKEQGQFKVTAYRIGDHTCRMAINELPEVTDFEGERAQFRPFGLQIYSRAATLVDAGDGNVVFDRFRPMLGDGLTM
jgi:hypothetical protein